MDPGMGPDGDILFSSPLQFNGPKKKKKNNDSNLSCHLLTKHAVIGVL